jgi:hypothetical protein
VFSYNKAKVRALRPIKFSVALNDLLTSRPNPAEARTKRNKRKAARKETPPPRKTTTPAPRARVARRAAARAAK